MKVRRVALTDLTESQAHKLRLLKAALEQVMGHEVQTMTLSYTDSGSPRLRVGFSVTLLGASSPAATSTAPAVPAPSPGRPPSSVVLVDRRFGGEDELVEEPDVPIPGAYADRPSRPRDPHAVLEHLEVLPLRLMVRSGTPQLLALSHSAT